MKRPRLPPPLPKPQAPTSAEGHKPSSPSDTEQLLKKLALERPTKRLEPPLSEFTSTKSQSTPSNRPTTPIWRRSPWLYTPQQWNPLLHSHLPIRYKWSYALRQTPRLLVMILAVSIRQALGQNLDSSSILKRTSERTLIGRFIYNCLTGFDGALQVELNTTIRPWGYIGESRGLSNYATFTGDRELSFCSYKYMGGRGIRLGAIVAFIKPPNYDYVRKRVRGLEGEIFTQTSRFLGGTFKVQVRRTYSYQSGCKALRATLRH